MGFNRARASAELAAALDAADAADAVIAPMYRSNVAVEIKADRTPVTEADRRAEAAIRAVLGARFPDHGFYGEEGGQQGMQSECVWLVDPLDGTKSFVRDTPFFSTQIALLRRGELVLGVSSACVAGERAWAEKGAGAWLNGERIRVSDRAAFGDAILFTGNLKTLASGPAWQDFGGLVREMNRVRGYGDFVHYHLLARGAREAHRFALRGGRHGAGVQDEDVAGTAFRHDGVPFVFKRAGDRRGLGVVEAAAHGFDGDLHGLTTPSTGGCGRRRARRRIAPCGARRRAARWR